MRSWSIPVGRLFGIEIRIHLTFLFLLVFVWSTESNTQDPTAVLRGMALVGIIFGSVVLHELGHALVARGSGIPAKSIILLPIGGITMLDEARAVPDPQNAWKREVRIALAGPLVNLAIAGVSALILLALIPGFPLLVRPPMHSNALLRSIVWANLYLGLFNLLPAYPMDGGRILRSLLAFRRPKEEATRVAAGAGQLFAILMGLAGLLYGNFMLMFVALFVYLGALQESAAARGRIFTSGFPVSAAAITDFRTLRHSDTLRDAGELLLTTSQHDFPVMNGESVIGLLTRSSLVRAMMNQGPDTYVAGVMDRDFLQFPPTAPLSDALPKLAGGVCALVMDDERLVGILTSEHVSEFILLRQAGMSQQKFHPA